MPNLWDRRENEPNMWYDRFVRYYLQRGSGRSVLGAYNAYRSDRERKPASGAPRHWIHAAERWRWKERAEAYDADLRAKDAALWEQRRLELQQRDWDIANKLTDKALAMLSFPVSEQHVEQDGKTIVIQPARWSQRDIAQIVETASKMARLAAGLATAHNQNDNRDAGDEAVTLEQWKADRAKRDAQRDQMLRDFGES